MVIVADEMRRDEFERKMRYSVFDEIRGRVNFLEYNALVKQYEDELLKANQLFVI